MTRYMLKRRLLMRGMRTKHDVWTNIVNTIKEGMLLVGIVLGMFLIWNTSVLSETIVREATLVEKLEQTWMSCLNHGAVYIGGSLHICKTVNTGFKQNDKHLEDLK